MMASVSLKKFRSLLQRLLERSQTHSVEWALNEEEDTLDVELDEGTSIRVFSRFTSEHKQLVGTILQLHYKIAATLSAEEGDADFSLLHQLHEEAESAVEGDDEEIEKIEEALESEEKVGRAPREEGEEGEGKPFDPFQKKVRLSLEDLTDGDSAFHDVRTDEE